MIDKALAKSGITCPILTDWMGWFGDGSGNYHPMTRYVSNNKYTIAKQLDLMQLFGIKGVRVTWQGPTTNPQLHAATQELCSQLGERGMLFMLLLDPWISKAATPAARAALIASALNDPTTQAMLNSPAYVPEKFVCDFDTGADFGQLATAFPKLNFLMRHTGYSWPEIQDTLAALQKDNSNPAMKIPGLCPKFFDGGLPGLNGTINYGAWSWGGGNPARCIEDQAGNFWHDQVAVTPKGTPYVSIATWNDYNERTAIEWACSIFAGERVV